MEDAKYMSTPLTFHFKLYKEHIHTIEQERDYMARLSYTSAIGSLMYTMVYTRPNIAYVVGVVNRYMNNLEKQ